MTTREKALNQYLDICDGLGEEIYEETQETITISDMVTDCKYWLARSYDTSSCYADIDDGVRVDMHMFIKKYSK